MAAVGAAIKLRIAATRLVCQRALNSYSQPLLASLFLSTRNHYLHLSSFLFFRLCIARVELPQCKTKQHNKNNNNKNMLLVFFPRAHAHLTVLFQSPSFDCSHPVHGRF
jgi:hypothetical protein